MNILYAAIVIIYFIGEPPIRLDDVKGPYKTMQECKDRAEIMFQFAVKHFKHLSPRITAGCEMREVKDI